jgi:uncharacterized protein (DUF58 family)
MTFRPSPLAYTLAVVIAWLICLAIAIDRVELFFTAIPLLVRVLWSPAPAKSDVRDFNLATEPGPRLEGEDFVVTGSALIAKAAGPIEILPILPPLLIPLSARRTAVFAPHPEICIEWSSHLHCRASGVLDFGVVFFRLWDQAGLWVAESRQEQRTTLLVHPRATPVHIVPTPRETGAPFGIHASRKVGDGTDFADIRRFTAGDRMKRINWAVSLRMRQLHVNQFFVERSAEVILLLDAFSEIGARPDSSLDHCVRAAAGLAMAFLRHHDRVGLLVFGGWVRWTKPSAGPTQYANIVEALARVSIAPSSFLHDLSALRESTLPRHAMILALTPLIDERFSRTVIRLADQGRDVVLLAIRTDELSEAFVPRRANHPLVRRIWLLERDERLRELRGHGVRATNWSPSLPIEMALESAGRPNMRSGVSWYN